jgi:glycosyltransferase involved in cell wall biosynthesis
MRVLIHALSARRGGGQTYLTNLLADLDPYPELEVHLLAPDSLQVAEHPRLHRLQTPGGTTNPITRTAWERSVLPGLIRKLQPDVAFFPGGLITINVPRFCRSATMFRNMIPFDPQQRQRYPLGRERLRNWVLERALLNSMLKADLVIFLCEYASQVIEQRAGRKLTNATVIEHGLPDEFRNLNGTGNSRPSWLPAEPYLLYVSPFLVYKNQLEVVHAYALLRDLRRTPERLVLAGGLENSEYGQRVKQEIERRGLNDAVIITGELPYRNLPELYHHALVNLFASESENCPNTFLEALGAGRPVLASNRPPMPDFGLDAALYFDPAKPEQLCHQLLGLLDNPSRMAELGRRAYTRSQAFDWRSTSRRTWEALFALQPAALTR